MTAALEARITRLAYSELPAGAASWTLSLLNEKLVSLDYIEKISDESIRRVLKTDVTRHPRLFVRNPVSQRNKS